MSFPIGTGTVSASTSAGGTVSAQVSVKRDGTVTVTLAGPTQTNTGMPTQWARTLGSTVGDSYYVRCVTLSGGFIIGTPDTWLQLSADRSFGQTRSTLGASAASGQMQFAGDAAGSAVLAAFNFDLSVSSSAG